MEVYIRVCMFMNSIFRLCGLDFDKNVTIWKVKFEVFAIHIYIYTYVYREGVYKIHKAFKFVFEGNLGI